MKPRTILIALILLTLLLHGTYMEQHADPGPPEDIERPTGASEPTGTKPSQQQTAQEETIPHTETASEKTEESFEETDAPPDLDLTEEEISPDGVSPSPEAESDEPLPAPAPPATLPRQRVVDGQKEIWVPGFGWVPDEGGGGTECTIIGSDGDINKMVGHM